MLQGTSLWYNTLLFNSTPVLKNTYDHVYALDYPNFKVWVLDDGDDDNVRQLAESYDFNYIVRGDRPFLKKAGNLRSAFKFTSGEFSVIFDADFCPRTDFLKETIPYMQQDPLIAVLQTPQYFRVRKEQTWVEKGGE
jgi:cellulose synthase/poly-beta-1,6-N-acetylglucosamine synthase-like glycosyltransferase